ncbi:MAG: glyoxalase superfamily protein [bacterium]
MDLDSAVLYSHDINKVIPFYRDILGFKLEYEQPNKFVSFIFPNGGRLGIKTAVEEREKPGGQTVFIGVDDIEKFYNQFKSANLDFYEELADRPWAIQFSILDPDKNRVEFMKRK